MVRVVPLTTQDGSTLEDIHKACFSEGWDQKVFDPLLNDKLSCGWMALSLENLPIGFILARVLEKESEILTFAVHPSAQGDGVGFTLLRELMSFLKSVGCAKIYLEVAVDNVAAITLYNHMGFCKVGIRPNYYKRDANTYISAFIMACEHVA